MLPVYPEPARGFTDWRLSANSSAPTSGTWGTLSGNSGERPPHAAA
ncbi:MAG: hypothetical protein ACAF41_33500 (plasmid) [Leptolyngbya sp. BL-A-14]